MRWRCCCDGRRSSVSGRRSPVVGPWSSPVTVSGLEERTAERAVRGVVLFERRIGAGPATVVLHGGPGAHYDYLLPGFDRLAHGRTLVYYDQRGGGRSAVPRETPVGWREQVADLEALRGLWGLDRLSIAGYSWGGLLALLYALEHPDRVERLARVPPARVWKAARAEFERRLHGVEQAFRPAARLLKQ